MNIDIKVGFSKLYLVYPNVLIIITRYIDGQLFVCFQYILGACRWFDIEPKHIGSFRNLDNLQNSMSSKSTFNTLYILRFKYI